MSRNYSCLASLELGAIKVRIAALMIWNRVKKAQCIGLLVAALASDLGPIPTVDRTSRFSKMSLARRARTH